MVEQNIKVKVKVENNIVIDKTEEKKLCKILVSKGENGKDGTVSFDELTEAQKESLKGEDGKGVPAGGTAGQILAKISDEDYEAEWIDNNAEIDLTGYATKEEIPTKVSELENDSNYLSSIPDEYITEEELEEKGYLTEHQDLSNYADKEYVDEKIANIDIGGGVDLSEYAKKEELPTKTSELENDSEFVTETGLEEKGYTKKEELNDKTNTSVIPNDNEDIKTKFRICNKSEVSSSLVYFPLAKLPKDNSKNRASVILRGRIGGYLPQDMAMINALIWNRGTTGISLFNINADTYTLDEPLRLCDIVVYTNSDNTDTVYLKCREYFVFDIDLEVYQSTANIIYDGTYLTEEPTGTLSAAASTSDKRVEVYNGKLYLNGTELTGGSDYELPIASAGTLGGIKVGANLTIDEDGTLNAVGGGISKNQLLDMVYPIGSLYMSMNETDPSELFGGSWERIKDRFIYANGDTTTPETLGGSATHNHGLSAGFTALNIGGGGIQYLEKQVSAWGTNAAINIATSYQSYQTKSWGIGLGGSTDNANNMPPYITAYIWKRIA